MDVSLIHEGERLDELHRKGYMIIQDPSQFCFGIDAVLLSAFARAGSKEKVLDIGTGTGIIPVLMEVWWRVYWCGNPGKSSRYG